MYWRAKGINILPCLLDDLLFLITGCEACRQLTRMVEHDMRLADLSINWEKSDDNPSQERIHLGIVVNLLRAFLKYLFIDGKRLIKQPQNQFSLPKVL